MRVVILFVLATMAGPAWSEELRVGAVAESITPPAGIPMAGYYSERGAKGVHDELQAKAIVLETGGATAALVALDLITTPRDLVEDARREIERVAGIHGSSVMISATHSHTGPVLDLNSPFGGQSDLVKRYRALLPGKIAEAVRRAKLRLTPARALAAHGRETSIAFNRRYHMKDGTVGWNPGKKNPNVLKPAGTIDPDVPVIFFESMDRKPLAAYVNYAVHLDNIGEPLISADMPATLSRCLADYSGPELVTVFTAGCCGDVNHIDVDWSEAQRGFGNAARMGTILAAEVLRTWPRLRPVAPSALRVKSAVVRLPLPDLSVGDEETSRAIVTRIADQKSPHPKFLEMVQALKVRDVVARQGRPQEVEVQAIALGNDIAWVSLPGEIFTELGLAIKQDSPFPHTIVAELTNGSIGYIPSRRAYAQGNYEVVSARCAEGSGERLVDAAVKLLTELHAEKTGGDER
jgi:neutral ceramidase